MGGKSLPAHVRRPNHIAANDFDIELYKLICRAEQLGRDAKHHQQSIDWGSVVWSLREARVTVREMMHRLDRQETR